MHPDIKLRKTFQIKLWIILLNDFCSCEIKQKSGNSEFYGVDMVNLRVILKYFMTSKNLVNTMI